MINPIILWAIFIGIDNFFGKKNLIKKIKVLDSYTDSYDWDGKDFEIYVFK